ncbi:MAG: tripartite tricarboxylate transporter substrate binding protein [Acetobacteraceae bacterium]|nr:tripartite tricarboxylate transporter substrate binding protein [Acetobacteraceae bacterium]
MHRRPLLALPLLAPGLARAQPAGLPPEIRLLVPFAAGGATDLLARRLQSGLEPRGVKLVVENATGGGSMVAMNRLAQSRPDGRTLGLASHGLIGQIAAGEIPLRMEQFTPLVRVAGDPSIMVTGARSRFTDFAGVLAALRSAPGPTIGSAGPVGTVGHLRLLGLAQEARGDFTYVGYPGASRIATELVGGHLDLGMVKPNDVFGQIRSGELRVLVTMEDERIRQLPDVPRIGEFGINPWPFGRMPLLTYVNAPAGLDPTLRDNLITLFRETVLSTAYQSKADEDGYTADALSGEALAEELRRVHAAIRTAQERARV